ncbi:MAG: DUF2147 domain-containing protein [Caulobacteraceae bacterium]
MTRLPAFIAALFALLPGLAGAAPPLGMWLTPDRAAKVRLAPCGAELCGTIVWLKEPLDPATSKPRTDVRNVDPSLRARPIVGLRLLDGLKAADANHWRGGRIYDPRIGKTFPAKLTLRPDGGLDVQGCAGPFCVTQVWTPAN